MDNKVSAIPLPRFADLITRLHVSDNDGIQVMHRALTMPSKVRCPSVRTRHEWAQGHAFGAPCAWIAEVWGLNKPRGRGRQGC